MTETRATWDVIDRGKVPVEALEIDYDCPICGRTARLPVVGMAIAMGGGGVIFDRGEHEVPALIRCRHCRRSFEKG